jgi:HPt (histidine-containing phosphotransfer) domain-containing protein
VCSSFDRSVLDRLRAAVRDESGALTGRMIAKFSSQGVRLVDDLERAARDDDRPALFLAAHTLRGSGGAIGGVRLVQICDEIEHWQEGDVDIEPLVASVRAEVRTLTDALSSYT